MAALFGFGAFSTDAGGLIEQATDNSASAGNIALHLQICDVINSYDNGPKDAVNAIRKRLTSNAKNFHIISLTLTVLETCVKNCGHRFHFRIANREFLKDLISVTQPKNNPPTIVRERILTLIQYWADAFKSKPDLSAVNDVYQQLKSEGVEFPPLDLDTYAPIDTPNRAESSDGQSNTATSSIRSTSRSVSQRPIGPLKPEQIAKLLSELDVVRRNLDVMNELLIENEPGKESEDDFSLMQELHTTLLAMQERATQLIGRVQDEIVMESLLQINDELNSCFTRYDRHLKNRQASQQQPTPAVATVDTSTTYSVDTSTPAISYPSLDEDLPPPYDDSTPGPAIGQLIDIGFDLNPPPATTTANTSTEGNIVDQLAQIGITPQEPSNDLLMSAQHTDFDMFASSRLAYSNTDGSTYEDNIQEQGTSIASALHRLPQPEPAPVTPNEYETIQEWMGTNSSSNQQQQNPDQATSAEFDQFLADRASKGSRHRPQMQKQEDLTDELFQL